MKTKYPHPAACIVHIVNHPSLHTSVQNPQLQSLMETWFFREDINLMMRMIMKKTSSRRKMKRTSTTMGRGMMTITKLSSVINFWTHQGKRILMQMMTRMMMMTTTMKTRMTRRIQQQICGDIQRYPRTITITKLSSGIPFLINKLNQIKSLVIGTRRSRRILWMRTMTLHVR